MERTQKSSNNGTIRSISDSLLKRTSSSINVAVAKSDLYLKEVRNFGTSDDKIFPFSDNDTFELEHGENYEGLLNKIRLTDGMEMKTTDLFTNETVIIRADTLLHQGKQYTFDDIATKWKKDCRTWLWKNKKNKKRSIVDELQTNFEHMGL